MEHGRRPWKTAGLLAIALSLVATASAGSVQKVGPAQRARLLSEYGRIPIHFEENQGQTDGRVKFLSRGSGYALFLTQSEAVVAVANRSTQTQDTIRMRFAGANQAPVMEGQQRTSGTSHHYWGSDRSQWHENVSQFERVAYRNLYRGIDLVYYGNQKQLEYDFVVAPGADPNQIRMRFDGIRAMSIDASGDLVLQTANGALHQRKPVIYQDVNGVRRSIDGRYVIDGKDVRFQLARYDARKPLVIDPVLAWASYLGGENTDSVNAIAVDSANSAYVTGYTVSVNFPGAAGAFPSRGLLEDVFVTKFAPSGASIVYTTFLGGSLSEQGTGIAVDSTGSAFVAGWTRSLPSAQPNAPGGFPITAGVPQATYGGGESDAFIARLTPAGTISWATYFGGFGEDRANGIALDSTGRPVIAGFTTSTNLFVNVLQTAAFNQNGDGFITKVSAEGNTFVWSTYFGFSGRDEINGIAIDSNNAVYVAGSSNSTALNFPNPTIQFGRVGQSTDAFVAKVAAAGSPVVYWTFHGGAGTDIATDIAVDSAFNAYVLGSTDSTNFPITNALQATNRGLGDMFLAKYNPTGTARLYSTYLGGGGSDEPGDIAVDDQGSVYISGSTNSTDFPSVDPLQFTYGGGNRDAVAVQVNPTGSALVFSSYIGSFGDDVATTITVDAARNVYLGGSTGLFGFIPAGGAQLTYGGGIQDGFVMKLSNCVVGVTPTTRTHLPSGAVLGGGTSTIAIAGSADCQWAAVVDPSSPWITITSSTTGTGPSTLTYSVTANASAPRTGAILIGGQRVTIEQQGSAPASGCLYPLEPELRSAGPDLSANTFRAVTLAGCNWTASSSVPWLQVFPLNGTGSGTLQYTVFPNFGTQARLGTITVSGGGGTRSFTVLQNASGFTEQQRFIVLAYFRILGRYPTAEEIVFQDTAMRVQGLSRAQIIANFFTSPEAQLRSRFVAALYTAVLNRDAEFGGWLFQRTALGNGTVDQTQLVENFITSAEFQLVHPSLSNDEFVRVMYRQALKREAGPAEVTFQSQQIALRGRATVAASILLVPEFAAQNNARLNAFLMYATLLGRAPSPDELAVRSLQFTAGIPVTDLAQEFVNAPEFQANFQ